ncbi:MAG: DUF262 domain-containing protein [Verrucomicrobiota bacterium JB022]|nr:DUF262 domain-containing protein [Verrucomicrobiota bacterium JB022]
MESEWFEDYSEDEDLLVREYDITSTPNDFNVATLFSFVESGAVSIPGFQRNFVWDIKRSSKLIESLILGLPVPQLFLYEQARNKFLVIDGQQRLMSIYYFKKQRYPRKEKRGELRAIFEENGGIPDDILHDDEYFSNFRLSLPGRLPEKKNPYSGKSYSTLGEFKVQFDLRPIRNVVVRQNSPEGDDSSVFEIFSRLNSGGVNLTPQEIRLSLYHSAFYDILMRMNMSEGWRRILSNDTPDLHLKDVEVMLRLFAVLIDHQNYSSSMVKFLNQFSRKCQQNDEEMNAYLIGLFNSFIAACGNLPDRAFLSRKTGRFSIALVEAVFTAASQQAFAERRLLNGMLEIDEIEELAKDETFVEAATKASTHTSNLTIRLERGRHFITSL